MSSYYSYYKSNKPTLQTKKTKEQAYKEYREALERRNHLATTNTSSFTIPYKTAFLLLCGGLIVGIGVLIYSVGYKTGKSKRIYKRYSS